MDDRSRVLMSALAGAVIGGLAGYLVLTEQGRRVRRQLEPTLDDFIREIQNLGVTVNRARTVAAEGWRVLNQAAAEGGTGAWNAPIRQQTPF